MSNEEKLQRLREIENLDVDAGLKTIMNMVPAYLKVLGLLVKNRERDRLFLESMFAEENTDAFTIAIHGNKSSLGNLGAFDLSKMALELEMASVDNNRQFIKEELPKFNEAMAVFTEKLRQALDLQ
jgi:HPt (histidine-containing phosphotransfer) domain-containing protein